MKAATVAVVGVIAIVLVSAFGYLALQPGSMKTGTTTTRTSPTSSQASSSSTSSGCGIAPGQPDSDWTTYHGNNSRNGDAFPAMAGRQLSCAQLAWKTPPLYGVVYAEPLTYKGVVVVATEEDMVYGLNLTSGAEIWSASLGTPVNGSSLPCGNIDPTGVTATPVIDPATSTVYVLVFKAPGAHYLVALDLNTGNIRSTTPADPPGADPHVQQERSALSLGNGRVYVMYGGLAGDCGDYHGWVVGVNADGSGGMVSYEVPTEREAGIWAPSGAALDSSGNLFVTSGNGASLTAFDFSNAVIELSPTLQELAYFTPSNWVQLNQGDTDLGSVGPMLLGEGEVFQVGKEGVGYLLNASHLGGVGGQKFSGQVCSSAFGGTASAGNLVFVSCTDGLVALNTTSTAFSVLWQGPDYPAGPPIVTGSVVWTMDTSNGWLHGYQVDTGAPVFSTQTGGVTRFTTPSAGEGRVIVAAGSEVFAFLLGF